MKVEQLEFHFEDGELVAPVSRLYKSFVFNMLEKAVTFGDSPLLHEYLTKIMKEAFAYDTLLKKTPKQFQEEVHQLLELPYETVYEMILNEPCPYKEEEEKPKLRLVK